MFWLEGAPVEITKAKLKILRDASRGDVDGYMQRRRPCEVLEKIGLLEKTGLMSYKITDRGRHVLSRSIT